MWCRGLEVAEGTRCPRNDNFYSPFGISYDECLSGLVPLLASSLWKQVRRGNVGVGSEMERMGLDAGGNRTKPVAPFVLKTQSIDWEFGRS